MRVGQAGHVYDKDYFGSPLKMCLEKKQKSDEPS
jgi:hypothetical protein